MHMHQSNKTCENRKKKANPPRFKIEIGGGMVRKPLVAANLQSCKFSSNHFDFQFFPQKRRQNRRKNQKRKKSLLLKRQNQHRNLEKVNKLLSLTPGLPALLKDTGSNEHSQHVFMQKQENINFTYFG